MSRTVLFLAAAGAALTFAETAFAAGPPPGVTMGPPSFVIMGPPASVTMGPPASVTMGPPASVTMGPPAGVTMGPPAGVTMGPPTGVTMGPPPNALAHIQSGASIQAGASAGQSSLALNGAASGQATAANELGKLNAAHASTVAFEHAAPNSSVGIIATYDDQMNAALGLSDPAARDAAITAARQQLALASNKQLTPSAIARIDGMLGITGADPALGTTP